MSGAWPDGELLAFDLETTGVDKFDDVPVSFALVELDGGAVVTTRTALVDPGRPIPPGAAAVHGITDEQVAAEGIEMAEAIREIAQALLGASERGTPVVGFNLSYDLTMVDACHRRLFGTGLVDAGWRGPVVDPLVLDRELDRYRKGKRTLGDMCELYGVRNEAAHDACGDATASALVLRALVERYPDLREVSLDELTARQAGWHRRWAQRMDEYFRKNGRPGFDERDFDWPISGVDLSAA